MTRFYAAISASLMAACAATFALLPILIVNLAVFRPQGMRVASLGEGAFMGFMILMMSPITFMCFLIGAAVVGSLSYWGLRLVRAANASAAVGLAGLSSLIAARSLLTADLSNGDMEVATSVAIAGAIGGLVFHRRLSQRLKPPPAPRA